MATTKKNRTKNSNKSPLTIGNKVFIRTVTNYFTGEIVGLTKDEILLKDACWVASTKRWGESLATGELDEQEPYPDGVISVNRGAYVDATIWAHELPRTAK